MQQLSKCFQGYSGMFGQLARKFCARILSSSLISIIDDVGVRHQTPVRRGRYTLVLCDCQMEMTG